MATLLVVDDEKHIRSHLKTYLQGLGHAVDAVSSAEEALALLAAHPSDVVFADVRMAGMDGLALLRAVKARYPSTVVVLMTAYATVPQAVEAMRAGAYDYLVKPFALEEVGVLLERIAELQRLRMENERLRRAVEEPVWLESSSAAMQRALTTARQVAASGATILLTGESGTGKTVIARQIHAWSPRARGPFVTIACASLAEHLLESELFGHMKGAFTGAWKDKPGRVEAAAGGTLFLDEIGELPLELQAKLLRVLEDRCFERVGGSATMTVDARIIAATNRDLEVEVAAGRFRADLFFRLSVVEIKLPALRERRSDLPALIDHVFAVLAARHGQPSVQLAPKAREVLEAYEWPGNVRELVNALERAIVISPGAVVSAESLPDRLLEPASARSTREPQTVESLEAVERRHITRALAESATLEEAAAHLGINVTTLWRKRKRYGID